MLLIGTLVAQAGVTNSRTQGAPAPPFERIDVPVGVRTNTVLTVEPEGDGADDLLVVGDDRVLRLHNRGDGRFEVVASTSAGVHAVDLARADLDEDGREDLVVANHETDHVTLLFGTEGGGFARRGDGRLPVGVSPHPHAVRLADLDGDGHVDLLVDDRDPGALRRFRGDGSGDFVPWGRVEVGGDPYRGMTLVDLDGDGHLDLLTPNPDHVAVLVGDGRGGFTPAQVLPCDFSPFSVTAADVDGDGQMDVAAASGEGSAVLAVWNGTGGGEFRRGTRHVIPVGATRMAAADLDGDGKAELIVTSYVGEEVSVRMGGAEPVLHRMELEGSPYGVATGDVDGDGRADVIVANEGAEHLTVFLMREQGR